MHMLWLWNIGAIAFISTSTVSLRKSVWFACMCVCVLAREFLMGFYLVGWSVVFYCSSSLLFICKKGKKCLLISFSFYFSLSLCLAGCYCSAQYTNLSLTANNSCHRSKNKIHYTYRENYIYQSERFVQWH